MSEAERIEDVGPNPGDMRFLRWLQERNAQVVASVVARQFFGADPNPSRGHYEFQRAKTLLESLAFGGYLLRGRRHATVRESQDFAFTTYRLSPKAKALLSTQAL